MALMCLTGCIGFENNSVISKYYGIVLGSDDAPKQWESALKSLLSIVCLQFGSYDYLTEAAWVTKVKL